MDQGQESFPDLATWPLASHELSYIFGSPLKSQGQLGPMARVSPNHVGPPPPQIVKVLPTLAEGLKKAHCILVSQGLPVLNTSGMSLKASRGSREDHSQALTFDLGVSIPLLAFLLYS